MLLYKGVFHWLYTLCLFYFYWCFFFLWAFISLLDFFLHHHHRHYYSFLPSWLCFLFNKENFLMTITKDERQKCIHYKNRKKKIQYILLICNCWWHIYNNKFNVLKVALHFIFFIYFILFFFISSVQEVILLFPSIVNILKFLW